MHVWSFYRQKVENFLTPIVILCIFNLCIFECAQYVSALRHPKHHAVNGSTTQTMNRNGEANLPEEGRRRVYSLNHSSSASAYRHNLQRRSLHSQPINSHLNCSVEEELKRRRRMAGFGQSYRELSQSDSDSDPEAGEATETDEHQWKQVSDRIDMQSRLVLRV